MSEVNVAAYPTDPRGVTISGSSTSGADESTINPKAMNLSLTDDQLKQGLRAGLIVNNTIPSPSKPAILRLVVQDKSSGLAGSVRVPVNPR